MLAGGQTGRHEAANLTGVEPALTAPVSLYTGMPVVSPRMTDLSRAIAAAALIEGERFTLPGCGTLAGTYVSAVVDHRSGHVVPPRLRVAFEQSPDPTAPTLCDLLEGAGLPLADARHEEDALIAHLHAGGTADIGDLGTLHGGERVVFEGSEQGQRTAFWSGDPVTLEPLGRRGAPAGAAVAAEPTAVAVASSAAPADAEPAPAVRARRPLRRSSYVALATAAVVSICFGVFLASRAGGGADAEPTQRVLTVNQERLNRSPREATVETAGELPERPNGVEPGSPAPAQPVDDVAAAEFDPADLAGAAPTNSSAARNAPAAESSAGLGPADEPDVLAGDREAVVVLGSFSDGVNASRLTERVAAAGYLPYVDQHGDLTRVGVSLAIASDEELAVRLQSLRAEFNPRAWVLD